MSDYGNSLNIRKNYSLYPYQSLDSIDSILAIKNEKEMENKIHSNVSKIIIFFDNFIIKLKSYNPINISDHENSFCIQSLLFVDNLNLFIDDSKMKTIIFDMKEIEELIKRKNIYINKEEILNRIRYTEMTLIYYRKNYYRSLYFNNTKEIAVELDSELNQVNRMNKFDFRLFKQIQNIFWVVKNVLDIQKKNELDEKLKHLKDICKEYKKQKTFFNENNFSHNKNFLNNENSNKFYGDIGYNNLNNYDNKRNYYHNNRGGYRRNNYNINNNLNRKYYYNNPQDGKEIEVPSEPELYKNYGGNKKNNIIQQENNDIENHNIENNNDDNSNDDNITVSGNNLSKINSHLNNNELNKNDNNNLNNNEEKNHENNNNDNIEIIVENSGTNNLSSFNRRQKKLFSTKKSAQSMIAIEVDLSLQNETTNESNNNGNNNNENNNITENNVSEKDNINNEVRNNVDSDMKENDESNFNNFNNKFQKYHHYNNNNFKQNNYNKGNYYGRYNNNNRYYRYGSPYQRNSGNISAVNSNNKYYRKNSDIQHRREFVEVDGNNIKFNNSNDAINNKIENESNVQEKNNDLQEENNNINKSLNNKEQNDIKKNEKINDIKEVKLRNEYNEQKNDTIIQNNLDNNEIIQVINNNIINDIKNNGLEKNNNLDNNSILEIKNEEKIENNNLNGNIINNPNNSENYTKINTPGVKMSENLSEIKLNDSSKNLNPVILPTEKYYDLPSPPKEFMANIKEPENLPNDQISSTILNTSPEINFNINLNDLKNDESIQEKMNNFFLDENINTNDNNTNNIDNNINNESKAIQIPTTNPLSTIFKNSQQNFSLSNETEIQNNINPLPISKDEKLNTDLNHPDSFSEDNDNSDKEIEYVGAYKAFIIETTGMEPKGDFHYKNNSEENYSEENDKINDLNDNNLNEMDLDEAIRDDIENNVLNCMTEEEQEIEIKIMELLEILNVKNIIETAVEELEKEEIEKIKNQNESLKNNIENNNNIPHGNKYKDTLKNMDPKLLSKIKDKIQDEFKVQEILTPKFVLYTNDFFQENPQMFCPKLLKLIESFKAANKNYNKIALMQYVLQSYNIYSNKMDIILHDYLILKLAEVENPEFIWNNMQNFEKLILIPLYKSINYNANKKYPQMYKTFKSFERIISKICSKDNIIEKITPYGSFSNNFMSDAGDIDICVVPKIPLYECQSYVEKIKDEIKNTNLGEILDTQINGRFILIKTKENRFKYSVDITFHNMLCIINTKLIREYSLYDQRFHIMGIYLKNWAKVNKIHGAPKKFLSSYALLLMLIHFLQKVVDPPVLPNLQRIPINNDIEKPIYKEEIYEYSSNGTNYETNIYFEKDMNKIDNYMEKLTNGKENKETVVNLLIKFFEFYSYFFDDNQKISIHKELRESVKDVEDNFAFSIEDPFEAAHNPGKTMTKTTLNYSQFVKAMKKEVNYILQGEYVRRIHNEMNIQSGK